MEDSGQKPRELAETGRTADEDVRASSARLSVVRLSTDVIIRDLGDGSVLIHLGSNRIYETNGTGGRFVELLATGRPLDQIRATLLEEYAVDEATVRAQTDDLLRVLAEEGLVDVDPPRR